MVATNKEAMPMDAAISASNKKKADYIGKLMITAYTHAKRLTLSAHTWPARYVAMEAAQNFAFNRKAASIIPEKLNLQYIHPKSHLELLQCIVEAGEFIVSKIKECLALSLRADGSIDRTQRDKIYYVMAKLITAEGMSDLVFLGVAEQRERGAVGLVAAVLEAIKTNIGNEMLQLILTKTSSICTDGTNVISGSKGGLWKLLEDEAEKAGSSVNLIKIWCAAHRSNLAFEDAIEVNADFNSVLKTLSSISSFYHTSAIRTTELKKLAEEKNLSLINAQNV